MNEWADLLNNTAQSLLLNRVDQLSKPSAPVAKDPLTGTTYKEGQPAPKGVLAGIPQSYLMIGGAVAAIVLVGYLVSRK
jgi:hypothetical protein